MPLLLPPKLCGGTRHQHFNDRQASIAVTPAGRPAYGTLMATEAKEHVPHPAPLISTAE